jgi:hypothetical protein
MQEDFVNIPAIPEMYDERTVSVDLYAVAASSNVVATEKLEWKLNTDLPAVAGLITSIQQLKTRLTLKEIRVIKRMPIDGYNSFSLLFGLVNYVPNPAVTYTKFTDDDYNSLLIYPGFGNLILEEYHGYEINGVSHTSSLSYAVDNNTTDYLTTAYPDRSAVPMFNVRFGIGEKDISPQYTMLPEYKEWFNKNIDLLTEKGWDINNPKSRVGFYVAGKLVGDPWEQYLKVASNPYICTIDIIEEE